MIETNNILTHPTGPEYQLVVGEGMAAQLYQRLEFGVDRNVRNLPSQGRLTPCDAAASSLRSSNYKSESSCDDSATSDSWNQDIAIVLQLAELGPIAIQSRYEQEHKIRRPSK